MTYMTLYIRAVSKNESRAEMERSSLPGELVQDLGDFARQMSPSELSTWATPRNLTHFWIDNCWLRVAATAPDIADFVAEIGAPQTVVPSLGNYSTSQLIIEAEEF